MNIDGRSKSQEFNNIRRCKAIGGAYKPYATCLSHSALAVCSVEIVDKKAETTVTAKNTR
jgi:hypothetical protein